MYLFPFVNKEFTSALSSAEIILDLKSKTHSAYWTLSIDGLVNNEIMESAFNKDSFTIISGKFGLTYGKMSLFPVLKGKISPINGGKLNIVKVVISPGVAGVLVLIPFYLICFYGIYNSFKTKNNSDLIIPVIFMLVTYTSILVRFNKEVKKYLNFLSHSASLIEVV